MKAFVSQSTKAAVCTGPALLFLTKVRSEERSKVDPGRKARAGCPAASVARQGSWGLFQSQGPAGGSSLRAQVPREGIPPSLPLPTARSWHYLGLSWGGHLVA